MAEPTLHIEIRAILLELENRWTGLDELATRINQRGRYQKKDRSPVQAGQIHLRTRAGGGYENMFERKDRLVRLRDEIAPVTSPTPLQSEQVATPILPTSVVMNSLQGPGDSFEIAAARMQARPGLYALFGDTSVWAQLGLGFPPDARPLYIGKAERSLLGRDINQHFSDGRTGSSTVRRSIAALLHDRLGLRGIPRNRTKPADFDRYGLSPDHDAKLTSWMRSSLSIAAWESSESVVLAAAEKEMVRSLEPPLNLTIVRTKWFADVSTKRAQMAAEARDWRSNDA